MSNLTTSTTAATSDQPATSSLDAASLPASLITSGEGQRAAQAVYCAIDCETTGLSCKHQEAISVAVVLADAELEEVAAHHWLIHPERLHAAQAEALIISGYDEARWEREARSAAIVGRDLFAALKGRALIAHNLDFDKGFVAGVLRAAQLSPPWGLRAHCTLKIARAAKAKGLIKTPGCRLDELCAAFRLPLVRAEGEPHSALDDARAALALARTFRAMNLLR